MKSAGEKVVELALVREARERGQRYLLEVIAIIIGRYNRADDPAHKAARAALLAPIHEQWQAVRAQRVRRAERDLPPAQAEPPAGVA